MIARRKFHQIVFTIAGIYNIGWGMFALINPQWFFRFADIPPLNYPEIFACLGMVIGLYGIIYLVLKILSARSVRQLLWYSCCRALCALEILPNYLGLHPRLYANVRFAHFIFRELFLT